MESVRNKHKLTQQFHSKLVCCDVLKEGGEDGQQRHSHVVDALRDALHLGTGLHELAQFQHLQQLLQVLGGVLKESPKTGFDQLRAGLHHRSEGEHDGLVCMLQTGVTLYSRGHCASTGDSPGVEGVRENVQTAHHHGRVTSCERNVHCRRGHTFQRKGAHEHTEAMPTYQREKSCV